MPLLDDSCLDSIISSLKSNNHIPSLYTMPSGKGPPREEGGNDVWDETFCDGGEGIMCVSKDEFVNGKKSDEKENSDVNSELNQKQNQNNQYPKSESFMKRPSKTNACISNITFPSSDLGLKHEIEKSRSVLKKRILKLAKECMQHRNGSNIVEKDITFACKVIGVREKQGKAIQNN